MPRQSRTIDAAAILGGSSSARALGHLQRMAEFERDSIRVARASASIAKTDGRRWQLPASASSLRQVNLPESESAGHGDVSQRQSEEPAGSTAPPPRDRSSSRNSSSQANAWSRTRATIDAARRASWQARRLPPAMASLAQAERSLESGAAARKISYIQRRLIGSALKGAAGFTETADRGKEMAESALLANMQSSGAAREKLASPRTAFARAGVPGNRHAALPIPAMVPPSNVRGREFAELSNTRRAQDSGDVHAGITINSSPTVVINAPTANGGLQRDVLSALRAHRDELFDQMKRESTRRERSAF